MYKMPNIRTRGCVETRRSVLVSLVDSTRIGRVRWARDKEGRLLPVDLLNRLCDEDAALVWRFGGLCKDFRGLEEVLSLLTTAKIDNPRFVVPYLMLSVIDRVDAQRMILENTWDEFWESFLHEEVIDEHRAWRQSSK